MLRPSARALMLTLAILAASSAALLGGSPRTAGGPTGEPEASRLREIEALLESARQPSALCTTMPVKANPRPD